jgi:heme oxygenase
MSAIQELKARTTDLHKRIETLVPLLDRDLTISGYTQYLQQLFPFYQQLERCLRSVTGLSSVVADLDERWKTDLLAADLGINLVGSGDLFEFALTSDFIPQPRNIPEALGCLYVLEGSTLGAQILIRAVRGSLGKAAEGKTHFLESYQSRTGEKWRRLCAILNAALVDPAELEITVASARSTFAGLYDWLLYSREQTERPQELLTQ